MSHDHLSIKWPVPGYTKTEIEVICLANRDWSLHREKPLVRIIDRHTDKARYIPFTSLIEFSVEQASVTCPNVRGPRPKQWEEPNQDEPGWIGNSALMEPGSGIYLDVDGKVDERSPGIVE